MSAARVLKLLNIAHAPAQLRADYEIAGLRFSNTIWYEDFDWGALGREFGAEAVRNLLFHIAAFEINKLASLRPTRIEWGPFADLATPAFHDLWNAVFWNVWAQWRFENDEPDYSGPEMTLREEARAPQAISNRSAPERFLSFCGGGKDSLVAMKLLNALGVELGTLAYSTSFYGPAAFQHELIGRLIDAFGVATRHRLWVFDDFLDSPVLALRPDFGVAAVTAAETPGSIFAALPYVLRHGYRYVALAHERSADAPQLVWDRTGEPVNHQWGKSFEAERLLNAYIRKYLIADFDYFSILKPIYDVAIFGAARGGENAVVHTHSCNIRKPWCRRCAKCLYVWLGYTAFLDRETVAGTFGPENLFDVAENEFVFRQLVGLESQLPFECVGEADEAALFMKMAQAKGHGGRAIEACRARLDEIDPEKLLDKYLSVDFREANIPASIADALKDALEENARSTRAFARQALAGVWRS